MANKERVKNALSAHKLLGLSAATCLYWICLTGSLIVFAAQLARWEQPTVEESLTYSPATVQQALQNYVAETTPLPESVTIVLPSADMPRMALYDGETGYFINNDGSRGLDVRHEWLEFSEHLHTSLHLPHTLGTIVVGIFGVMLGALIITGLFAHPRIFRDAFRLRLGGNRRLQLADFHNRIGVWGLPFHLMMAVTGALFGMISILVIAAAPKYFEGDQDAIIETVYGAEPQFEAPVQPLQVGRALQALAAEAEEATPIYLVAQKPGTPQQFIEIAATLPGRLIYSEMYQFHADGRYQGYQQLSDGPLGRQIVYSIYRLHFGQYGGLWVRFVYVLMGLALTALCATGVSIWLARRGGEGRLNALWCAVVWGTPLAISAVLPLALLTKVNTVLVFVLVLLASMALALWRKDQWRSRALLQRATGICLLLGLVAYALTAGANPWQPVVAAVNGALLLTAVVLTSLSFYRPNTSWPASHAAVADSV